MTMSRSATGKPGPELVNSFVTSLNCFEMSSRERLKSIAPRGVRASHQIFPCRRHFLFFRAKRFRFFRNQRDEQYNRQAFRQAFRKEAREMSRASSSKAVGGG